MAKSLACYDTDHQYEVLDDSYLYCRKCGKFLLRPYVPKTPTVVWPTTYPYKTYPSYPYYPTITWGMSSTHSS